MDFELKRIIEKFNVAQEKAVAVLESNFECQRPQSSHDFILRCVTAIRKANYEKDGYKIRPHGIGMEVNIDGTKIGFDFGMNGEFNGFDAWQLSEFVRSNKIKSDLKSEDDFKSAIEKAVKDDEIVKSTGMGSIFYVNS
ncbi:hypothetical protein P3339_06200 [Microbulbifer sp. MLAF003]|uniref:DUF6896 domain-containing protein n=1 Tax=unclassified Microbulbifer TaxID=2619833 RepID=UPI0024ACFD2C|nr:hypothetical protein [Microbulbifer sp. MLAF003]WHI52371.1 hypothetical protein P3339_06200 [Microbulbifer sp. MLAF003]